tara:strand:+ start:957 stop:1577 length:621 start_codon:yes stop_codon:yes gene_type:complete
MARDASRMHGVSATPGDPDADRMIRLARGDTSAARELMDVRLPGILGLARRMLQDPIEAEDVAQETFLRVWKAADRWRPGEAKVSSWMSRIAINLCYDRLRKKRETLMEILSERESSDPGADDVLQAGEASQQVLAAMQVLPDRQRLAIELCHFQEMSNIEAAQMMDVSVDALESLLARARRKLRESLLGQSGDLLASFSGRQGEG